MPFHFNPSLWFVCKLCRKAFPDTEELKAHKLESHLRESLHIKCIVFEEKLFDHEWIPHSAEINFKQDQTLYIGDAHQPQKSHDIGDSTDAKATSPVQSIKFQNPYVSLKLLTAQEINSASAVKLHAGGSTSKSTAAHNPNFGFTVEIKRKLLEKRKLSCVAEDQPRPSKQFRTEESGDEDSHKNKIRELLSNAVIIKSEPDPDIDSRVPFTPEDPPNSVVPTYPLLVNDPSKFCNPENDNVPLMSLQQQQNQNQLLLQGNSDGFLPGPSTNCNIVNNPRSSQILPTFVIQPEQNYLYPVILNVSGECIQVQDTVESDNSNIFNSTLPSGPGPATTSVTNTYAGKVEFIEYHSIANQNVGIVPTEEPIQMSHANINSNLPMTVSVSESASTSPQSNELQKPFFCGICQESFRVNYIFRQHMENHSENRNLQCPRPKCNLKFTSTTTLRQHLIWRHGRASAYKCQYCDKSFPTKANLMTHEASHSGVRPFKCEFKDCKVAFRNAPSLFAHTRMLHGKELGFQQFECPTCGKSFGLRSYLNTHLKKVHKNQVMEILP